MGSGGYNFNSRTARIDDLGVMDLSIEQTFKSREIHESMKPENALLRESRDSDNHPNSFPIVIGLDVTASMGNIPKHFMDHGLPKIISGLMEVGIPDPQILLLGIGDHKSDKSPLQVGQFESADEEMDMWLERIWLESGGGGNGGESYKLAWYYAANHIVTDAFEKRGQKGMIITIGDEAAHDVIPKREIERIFNGKLNIEDNDNLKTTAEHKWDLFHINVAGTYNTQYSQPYWDKELGERVKHIEDINDIPMIIKHLAVGVYEINNPVVMRGAPVHPNQEDEEIIL